MEVILIKKFFEVLGVILLSPFILIAIIYLCLYSLPEAIMVKHTAYFKKNKLKLKEEYYYCILTDPVSKIKNLICKYNLAYEVIAIDEDKTYIVVNQNNECRLMIINMKNCYYENDKLYFQENTDDGIVVQVDEYVESTKSDKYNYDSSKLLVLKKNVSREDCEKIENNESILFVKEVNKNILNSI